MSTRQSKCEDPRIVGIPREVQTLQHHLMIVYCQVTSRPWRGAIPASQLLLIARRMADGDLAKPAPSRWWG